MASFTEIFLKILCINILMAIKIKEAWVLQLLNVNNSHLSTAQSEEITTKLKTSNDLSKM